MTTEELVSWGLNPQFITEDFLSSIGCSKTFPSRFVRFVTTSISGCWLWRWGHPYGTIGKAGAGSGSMTAHVASWTLHFGPIQNGLWVLHKCDVPRCVRPDHLFLGTPAQNMQDSLIKGRNASQVWSGLRAEERNGNSKLDEQKVRQILDYHFRLKVPYSWIAAIHGVSRSAVAFICQGRSWKRIHAEFVK